MADLASLEELTARLDWDLDEAELRVAASALEDASELARFYGRDWPTANSAPRLVKTTVLKACVRHMNNPQGYVQSRAGDETLVWNEDESGNAGTVHFTRAEQQLIAELAGRVKQIGSAPISAWNSQDRCPAPGRVPVDNDGKPFPLFSSDEHPW